MKLINGLLAVLAALAMVACGASEPEQVDRNRGGILSVKVQGLHNGTSSLDFGAVAKIVVEMQHSDASHAPVDFELNQTGPDLWEGRTLLIHAGTYTGTATGFDAAGTELFVTAPSSVDVEVGQEHTLVFYVNEDVTGEFDTPHFVSIAFAPSTPYTEDVVDITVNAAGGTGLLILTGRFAGGVGPAGNDDLGSFSAGSTFDPATESGTITWTAAKLPGAKWFVLTLTDEEGNVAEVGVDIVVLNPNGHTNVEVHFNRAPELNIRSMTNNDSDGTFVSLWFDATDEDAEAGGSSLDWAWTSTCTPAGTYHASSANGAAKQETGSWTAMPGVQVSDFIVFQTNEGGDRSDVPCELTLKVTDSRGSSSAETLTIHTGWEHRQ